MCDVIFWLFVHNNKFCLHHPDGTYTECALDKDALYNLYKEAGYNPLTQQVSYSSTVEIQDEGQVTDDVVPFEEAQKAFEMLLREYKNRKYKNRCKFCKCCCSKR